MASFFLCVLILHWQTAEMGKHWTLLDLSTNQQWFWAAGSFVQWKRTLFLSEEVGGYASRSSSCFWFLTTYRQELCVIINVRLFQQMHVSPTEKQHLCLEYLLGRDNNTKLAKNPKMISYFGFASVHSENSINNECRAYSIKNNKMLEEIRRQ